MSDYTVVFTSRAFKQFNKLEEKDKKAIANAVATVLIADPRGTNCKKLAGADGLWRMRCGDFRVIYTIEDNIVTVTVTKVGHRRDVYRNIP